MLTPFKSKICVLLKGVGKQLARKKATLRIKRRAPYRHSTASTGSVQSSCKTLPLWHASRRTRGFRTHRKKTVYTNASIYERKSHRAKRTGSAAPALGDNTPDSANSEISRVLTRPGRQNPLCCQHPEAQINFKRLLCLFQQSPNHQPPPARRRRGSSAQHHIRVFSLRSRFREPATAAAAGAASSAMTG